MANCPFANVLDPDTYKDGMPYEELQRIRRSGPVHWVEDNVWNVPYWLVTGRDEIDFISRNPKLFSSEARTGLACEFTEEEIARQRLMTINMDPPHHLKSRRLVRALYTPAAVDAYEAGFRGHAKRIVDAVAKRGACEFVEEVAAELPLLAILEMCGIPSEDRKEFFDWTNTMIFADDPELSVSEEERDMAAFSIVGYALQLAEQQRDNPKDNIVGALLRGKDGETGLTEEEFGLFFMMLIIAGNESTRTVTSHCMRLLIEHPEQLEYLVGNPDRIPAACEEMLRYNTAFISMRRTAVEDVELAGKAIRKGNKIIMHYHTVNQDESVFGGTAMDFDVRRAEQMPDLYNQHRAFGIGQHFCLGSHLARLELRIMMEEIIPRLRKPKLSTPIRYTRSALVSGIKEMNITFEPETAWT
ncbi:MAG: cytochrome P450 [Pseudomonadota bacterium]